MSEELLKLIVKKLDSIDEKLDRIESKLNASLDDCATDIKLLKKLVTQ